jgi:anti-sigma factor RsiW
MIDFLRDLTKSAEEKHQERVHAYLDDALTPRQRQQFEQEMAQDSGLQAEIDHLRLLKQQLRRLPGRPVPRSFTLDPALYGRPARQPLFQFYPVLQGATVLTALFFMVTLSLSLISQPESASAPVASAPQALEAPEAETVEEPMREEPATGLFAEDSSAEEAASAPAVADEAAAATQVVVEEEVEDLVEEAAEEETVEEEEAPAEAEAGEAVVSGGSLPQPTTLPPVAEAATPLPTATASQLPRPSATQTATVRLQTEAITEADGQDTTLDTTANNAVGQPYPPAPTLTPPSPRATAISPLNLAQIGLGILLIIFGSLTYFVRRRL